MRVRGKSQEVEQCSNSTLEQICPLTKASRRSPIGTVLSGLIWAALPSRSLKPRGQLFDFSQYVRLTPSSMKREESEGRHAFDWVWSQTRLNDEVMAVLWLTWFKASIGSSALVRLLHLEPKAGSLDTCINRSAWRSQPWVRRTETRSRCWN